MIHARTDYDHIQDSTGAIGEDEPVFLLRAKDRLAPFAMMEWARLLKIAGGSDEIVDHVTRWALRMQSWQQENGSKIPDAPSDALRDPNPLN